MLKATISILFSLVLFSSVSHGAKKTYQVTGPIVELSATKIVVGKGVDRWEIDRTAKTKLPSDLKVGQKVTIEYTMAADSVEIKESKKK